MDKLKKAFTIALALIKLNYNKKVRDIILIVNANLKGQGIVLMQVIDSIQHLARYKSEI